MTATKLQWNICLTTFMFKKYKLILLLNENKTEDATLYIFNIVLRQWQSFYIKYSALQTLLSHTVYDLEIQNSCALIINHAGYGVEPHYLRQQDPQDGRHDAEHDAAPAEVQRPGGGEHPGRQQVLHTPATRGANNSVDCAI